MPDSVDAGAGKVAGGHLAASSAGDTSSHENLILTRLGEIRARSAEIEGRFAEGTLGQDEIRDLGKELSHCNKILDLGANYEKTAADLASARELLDDPEMAQMAAAEIDELTPLLVAAENTLLAALRPVDPHEGEPVYLEIRAGTGGEEAALFAANLYRMYLRYTEQQHWHVEELSRNETGLHGLKELICRISGAEAWERLKFESGVHRVQRIPVTESGGRIHTSACTVALMPERGNVELNIRQEDLRIDVFRASGPGGQGVNTTDSAVRITHIPTGVVVTCQNERSQLKNRDTAMRVLTARLAAEEEAKAAQAASEMRRLQVGTGDRSERIRTYNFPQNRMTDHRIGLTLYKLDQIMEGSLDEMTHALAAAEAREVLGEVLTGSDGSVDDA